MEPVSISSLIISIAVAIAFLISKLHIKHCQSICCSSDCTSPPNSEKDFKIDDIMKPAGSFYNLNVIDTDKHNTISV
jgi:hypothetical protein